VLTANEAAELADVKPAQLKLWIESGAFKPSIKSTSTALFGDATTYYFREEDVHRLRKFAAEQGQRKPTKSQQFVDDGTQTDFTVAQIASMWQLSTDTIQRLFQDEPGVVTLGNKNPRGKRKRVTLRIPRAVMERVKKSRSNPK
jgi:MerR HTH family regulatory protein